jgi:DNA polymerase V
VPKITKAKIMLHTTIIVMLVVDKHSIQTSKYYFNCAVTLPYGSNSTLTIANAAIALKKLHAGNEHLKFKKSRCNCYRTY